MEVLRRLEEDVRNLGNEAKKKYPEVYEASEKALQALRTMRELYVADVMRKGSANSNSSMKNATSFSFRSSMLTSPYILACNYGDSNSKSMLALNGIQMLLECDAFDPTEAPNVVRVLSIQASGKSDVQIKVLQLLLQITTFLIVDRSANTAAGENETLDMGVGSIACLSEALLCQILSVSMALCDPTTHTALVVSTAISTSRQCISLFMERVSELEVASRRLEQVNSASAVMSMSIDAPSSSPPPPVDILISLRQIVFSVVQDMTGAVIKASLPAGATTPTKSTWLKGIVVPVPFALDVLCDMLDDCTVLFQSIPFYMDLLISYICKCIRSSLKTLQSDYVSSLGAGVSQLSQGNLIMTRVIRLSRSVLLHHVREECLEEVETITTLMIHTLHPDHNHPNGNNSQSGNGNAISRFLKGNSSNNGPVAMGGGSGGSANGSNSSSLFLSLRKCHGINHSTGAILSSNSEMEYIPSLPAGACLEALISLFLRPHLMEDLVFASPVPSPDAASGGSPGRNQPQDRNIGASCISTIVLSLCGLVNDALAVEANVRDFEVACSTSPIIGLVEAILTNISNNQPKADDLEDTEIGGSSAAIVALHDFLTSKLAVNEFLPMDLLILSFSLLQIIARLFVRCALQIVSFEIPDDCTVSPTSPKKRPYSSTDSPFISAAVLKVPYFNTVPPGGAAAGASAIELTTTFNIALKSICLSVYEICYESLRDTCVTLLALCGPAVVNGVSSSNGANSTSASANSHVCYVLRQSTGMMSEVSLTLGLLGIEQPCEYMLATLCKCCVPHQLSNTADSTAGDQILDAQGVPRDTLRKHHILSFTRLVQVIHILADRLTDWELIIDTFQQLHQHLSSLSAAAMKSPKSANVKEVHAGASSNVPSLYEEANAGDMAKLSECLEHFKQYSIYLSDKSLVHLMTSIVSLSFTQNDRYQQVTAASFSTSPNGAVSVNELDDRSSAIDGNVGQYVEGIYTLFTVITIVKLNLYRLSSIWQMISTHLRRLASTSKIGSFRHIVIESTLDLITTSLKYMVQYPFPSVSGPGTPVAKEVDSAALKHAIKHASFLQDDEDVLVATMAASSLMQAAHQGKKNSPASFSSSSSTNSASNTNILSSLSSATQFFVPRKSTSSGGSEKKRESVLTAQKRSGTAPSNLSAAKTGPISLASFVSPASSVLSDGFYLNVVCPTLETAFVPRELHKSILTGRYQQAFMNNRFNLTQADLLSSLKSMATMSTPLLENNSNNDVRHEILLGVYRILQESDYLNNLSSEGWITIIEVIALVPASHCPTSEHSSFDGLDKDSGDDEELKIPISSSPSTAWSNDSLSTAFSCIKLISEDFMHVLGGHVAIALIFSYYMFCLQQTDVNMSLTSVELLWKVTDYMMTAMTSETISPKSHSPSGKGIATTESPVATVYISDVVDAMMSRLLVLSSDSRPEIRNCAMKTLFAAMVAYVNHLPPLQWKAVFERVIFPLFAQTADKSGDARRNHTEAIAPEIKKGVKMSLHHSRDTAQKQWAETRVVALRGLTRVIKVSTRTLMGHTWFVSHCWKVALEVCVLAVQDASIDLEVAVAGIEVLFAMFKVVSSNATSNWNTTASSVSTANEDAGSCSNVQDTCKRMCYDVWTTIQLVASSYEMSLVYELSMKFCSGLSELYATEEEFRQVSYTRPLLQLMVKLSRQRLHDPDLSDADVKPAPDAEEESKGVPIFMRPKTTKNAMLQFQRSWILLMKSIVTSLSRTSAEQEGVGNSAMFNALCSQALCFVVMALSDVVYGGYSAVRISCKDVPKVLETEDGKGSFQHFGPVENRLRIEAGCYLSQLFTSYGTLSTIAGSAALQDSKESKGGQGSMSQMDSVMMVTMCNIVWHRFVFNVIKPTNVVNTLMELPAPTGSHCVETDVVETEAPAVKAAQPPSTPPRSKDLVPPSELVINTTPAAAIPLVDGIIGVFGTLLSSTTASSPTSFLQSVAAIDSKPIPASGSPPMKSLPCDLNSSGNTSSLKRAVSVGVMPLPCEFHLFSPSQFTPLFEGGLEHAVMHTPSSASPTDKLKYGMWAYSSVSDIQQLLLCFERKVHHSVKVTSFCLSPDNFVNGSCSGSPDLLSLGLLEMGAFSYALKGLTCVLMPHEIDGNDGNDGARMEGMEDSTAPLSGDVTAALSRVLDDLCALCRTVYELDNPPTASSPVVKLLITQLSELLCCLSNMFVQVSSCTISCLFSATSRAPLVFHYSCLMPLMSFLQRLVNCPYVPIVARKSALKGILDISQDLLACCAASTGLLTEDDCSLHSICEKVLDCLLHLTCPVCILPNSYIVRGHHNPTQANSFTPGGSIPQPLRSNNPYEFCPPDNSSAFASISTSTTDSTSVSAVSMRNQGHIVLLLPMLYQLLSMSSSITLPVNEQTAGIRKVVLELVSSIDMAELVRIYIEHLDKK